MTDTMNFADLSGKVVYDRDGEKIGEVSQMWLDDVTGQPDWITVRTGLFGMNESFLPCDGLRDGQEGDLRTSYTKQQVKDAPNVHPNAGHLDQDEENRLYRHYGINSQRQSPENKQRKQGMTSQGTRPAEGMAPTPATIATQRTGSPGQAADKTQAAAAPRDVAQRDKAQAVPQMGKETTHPRPETPRAKGAPERDVGRRDDTIIRSEERLRVGLEDHEVGRARLRKYVVTETEQVQVPVTRERVRLEREAITDENRASVTNAQIADQEYEVILHEQRPIVQTETVAVERIRLAKEEYTDTETVSGEVRKERIDIEGVDDERAKDPKNGRR